MSNDIILSIKSSLAGRVVDEETLAVAGKSATATKDYAKRISIKGGVFRKYVGGKEVASIEDRSMNIIFVKMAPTPSRTFYSSAYKEGEKTSPSCWSSDSKVPDAEVKAPQSTSCETCKWSVQGSGNGGRGTACKLSWRTAVVLPNDPAGDVMQLVLPATSAFAKEENGKWGFRPYCQALANRGIGAKEVETKMQFDTKFPVPKVWFSPIAALDDETSAIVKAQGATPAAENAVKLNVYQSDEGEAPAPAVAEPVLRKVEKTEAVPSEDVSDVIKKWSKKK
jgi:hypothetical protein